MTPTLAAIPQQNLSWLYILTGFLAGRSNQEDIISLPESAPLTASVAAQVAFVRSSMARRRLSMDWRSDSTVQCTCTKKQ